MVLCGKVVPAMKPIATFVFIDLETSSLPTEDNNLTKITELSLVAVKREHVLDTTPGATPRVQHKLTLCICPLRLINPTATKTTGLDNDLLEHEPTFDMQVFITINTFLNILTKPTCLVAQNGHNFDFPILKNHFEKLKVKLSEDILCADSLHAFYDIENSNNLAAQNIEIKDVNQKQSRDDINDEKNLLHYQLENLTQEKCENKISSESIVINGSDFENEPKSLQCSNEMTPKRAIDRPARKRSVYRKVNHNRIPDAKVRRRLFWSDGRKPTESYKLKDIYMRVLNRTAVDAHRAENDCIYMLEIAVAFGKKFVDWIDKNNCLFSDVKPMTIGVPLGE